jgi:hypothetical protein
VRAARRKPRRRGSLFPSAERLHGQVSKLEELKVLRVRKTFIFFPEAGSTPPKAFPEAEGPERGDLCIYFPPLGDAGETLESFLDRERPHALASAPAGRELPWRTVKGEAPVRRRDPDAELEALAEEREAPDIRPLTEGELQGAARGLLQTGNLVRCGVVRDALAGGQVPLGDDEESEFAGSDRGSLLIRIWNHRGEQPRPRAATESDRERWPSAFERFLAQCFPAEKEKK